MVAGYAHVLYGFAFAAVKGNPEPTYLKSSPLFFSRFTISSPHFQKKKKKKKWVKIHDRGKKVWSRFTKLNIVKRRDSPHFRKETQTGKSLQLQS